MNFCLLDSNNIKYYHCSIGKTRFKKIDGGIVRDSEIFPCGSVQNERHEIMDSNVRLHYDFDWTMVKGELHHRSGNVVVRDM